MNCCSLKRATENDQNTLHEHIENRGKILYVTKINCFSLTCATDNDQKTLQNVLKMEANILNATKLILSYLQQDISQHLHTYVRTLFKPALCIHVYNIYVNHKGKLLSYTNCNRNVSVS